MRNYIYLIILLMASPFLLYFIVKEKKVEAISDLSAYNYFSEVNNEDISYFVESTTGTVIVEDTENFIVELVEVEESKWIICSILLKSTSDLYMVNVYDDPNSEEYKSFIHMPASYGRRYRDLRENMSTKLLLDETTTTIVTEELVFEALKQSNTSTFVSESLISLLEETLYLLEGLQETETRLYKTTADEYTRLRGYYPVEGAVLVYELGEDGKTFPTVCIDMELQNSSGGEPVNFYQNVRLLDTDDRLTDEEILQELTDNTINYLDILRGILDEESQ